MGDIGLFQSDAGSFIGDLELFWHTCRQLDGDNAVLLGHLDHLGVEVAAEEGLVLADARRVRPVTTFGLGM
jgi:hypothetical protein